MKCTKEKFFELLDLIEKNEISQKEAALIAGYIPPHFSRLLKRYREEGEGCFINGHTGLKPNSTPTEEIKFFVDLYSEKYTNCSFKEYSRILQEEYKINKTYKTISKYLREAGLVSPDKEQHSRANKIIYEDYETLLRKLENFLKENNPFESQEYGLIYCCNLLFDSCWRTLKKLLSETNENKNNFRTSFSIIELSISKGIIDTKNEWEHWKKNHQYFAYPYNDELRKRSVKNIREVYFQMFKKIFEEIKKQLIQKSSKNI